MIFIDSNIWCYFFDTKAAEHKKVSAYLESILGKEEIVMNTVIAMEVAHYLIKNLGPIKGKEMVEKMLEFPFIVKEFDYNFLLDSIEMLSHYSHTGIGG